MIFLLVLLLLANLFWITLVVQLLIALNRIEYLPEATGPASYPRISVLIPARNESRILSQALNTLLQQDYPDFEVLVIDDHSEDDTYQIASSFAARDARVKVIQSADLPPYWRGKSWALQQAAIQATGSWLLLTDADILHHPQMLKSSVALAQCEKLDFLSVIPHLECETFWEKIVLPSWAAILLILRPFYKSNDPKSNISFASGGFILVKAILFRYVGGYDSIHTALAEDLQLAKLFKTSGYRIKTVLTRSRWLRTRMYRSFKEIWAGLSRHAFELTHYNPVRILAGVTVAYLLVVTPYVVAILTPLFGKWQFFFFALFPALIMSGMQTIINLRWGISTKYFFSFPVATAVYGMIMIHSMLSHYFFGGNVWKGRRYATPGAPAE
jgi:chlorobactene glucosyltransferase